jgi:hypothetical protein
MTLTARQLNRATLQRQLLLDRADVAATEGVRRVTALQAQEPPSPYLAMWNRLVDFDPSQFDRAFLEGEVVKATLMRVTLHAVSADDYPAFHEAMQVTLRAARLNDRRYRDSGLSPGDADGIIPRLVEFATGARTKDEMEGHLAEVLGAPPHQGVWWALRQVAPLAHAPTGGPWSFGLRPAYRAAPQADRPGAAEATEHLVWRYLEGFGPASPQDFAQFAMLRMPSVRPAFETLDERLVRHEGPDGRVLFDVPGVSIPDEDTPAPPRLMGMWDSILLAHADRSRIIPPQYRPMVIRRNGDVLPTLLVDGYVAGVWRPVDDGIEATAFHRLSDGAWDGLAEEASSLVAFLADREPAVYARYQRWWNDLSGEEIRVLPG